jgi:murein DD-endopeptidase MepM/ murein hydrolase activator NlpD
VDQLDLHIQKKGKNNSKGFYIALGVCLIAVGIAAWTTYDSVVNYAAPEDNTSPSSTAAPANNTVSGVFVSEAPSSTVPSSQASSIPASSAPSVVSKPTPSKAPAKQTEAKPWTYSYPVSRTVVQKFSEDPVFCQTTQDWRAHTGLDLSAKQGDPVNAIADGKVEKTYVDDKYGSTAIIMHGDVEAWYCGLKDTKVKAGDTVTAGQEIGTVGSIPIETQEDSHLHLMLKEDGKYIDPLSILK